MMNWGLTDLELKGASAKWKEYEASKSARSGSSTSDNPVPCDGCEPGVCPSNVLLGNFMSTSWGQNEGQNGFCPTANGGPCGRAVTGCVATSMMQVMRHHQVPTAVYDSYHSGTVNWSSMPNITSGQCALTSSENELSRMMASVGARVGMSYGATGSGASASNAASALRNDYLYASANRYSYTGGSYQTVIPELNNNRPVILDGGTHMWVTSGYYLWYSQDCTSSGLQLYMNWGWRGLNNGFYAFNNWTTTANGQTYDYNSDKHMTIVHPN